MEDFHFLISKLYVKQYGAGIKTDIRTRGVEESPEIYFPVRGHMRVHKGTRAIRWGKDGLFKSRSWENRRSTSRRTKPDHSLMPCAKINSKWNKDLKVRTKTINY